VIRLGNIAYSNCYPIHAEVCKSGRRPEWLRVTDGTPGRLNAMLASGRLDVAPCSSIEAARHPEEYAALDGVCIGSEGPIASILLFARAGLKDLDGARVALPRASATSRVLLQILLELRFRVHPTFIEFDDAGPDPIEGGVADAALFIGDTALRRRRRPDESVTDLGAEWTDWTGLPFVFALWLIRREALDKRELPWLCREVLEARDRSESERELERLAKEAACVFALDPETLVSYWRLVNYRLTDAMAAGLAHFFRLACQVGAIPSVPGLSYYSVDR
jgi:chorismate dehydratase